MSIWKWFGRRDGDLQDEIREHIEIETSENIARGMHPDEARRAAERAFGNIGSTRELVREAKPLYWLDTLLQDVRYGARHILRNPALSLAVVMTLTVGIGLNGSAFGVLEASLFRARVLGDATRFWRAYPQTWNQEGRKVEVEKTTYDDYVAYQRGVATLGDLAAYSGISVTQDVGEVPAFSGLLVTCNFFPVYGLEQAKLGRLLTDADCASDAPPAALLSEEAWESRFGRDPKVVGSLLHVNRQTLAIVGIVPARFGDPELYMPFTLQPRFGANDLFREPGLAWLNLAGRLKPDAARGSVQAQMAVLARHQDLLQPPRRTVMLVTNGSPIEEPGVRDGAIWGVYLMLGAPSLVLLVACANVSTLMLSQAASRRREIAVRLSLGAGRMRLLRMLITEVLLLASGAAALSIWLSYYAPAALMKLMGSPVSYSLAPDWHVFAYLGGAALLAGCLAGIAPALESLRVDISSSMKGYEGLLSTSGGWRARDTLVATQLALGLALLSSGGLIARGYYKVFTDNPGFDAARIMTANVKAKGARYTPEFTESFWRTVLTRARALPGVESACTVTSMRGGHGERITLPGQGQAESRPVTVNTVSPEYFETLKIPILRGRAFEPAEAEQPEPTVAIISMRLAESFWPAADPVNKTFRDGDGRELQIVGVARDTRSGMFYDNDLQVYKLRGRKDINDTLVVRFSGSTGTVAGGLRKMIREMDPRIFPSPHTLQQEIDQTTDHLYRATRIILILAALPVFLAVMAVYGVTAYLVTQRTQEMGIRIALGARPVDVIRLVMVAGGRVILTGLLIGWILSLLSGHLLEHAFQHMGISMATSDPMIVLAASVAMALTAAGAMFGPARRASTVDPVEALRHE